MGLQSFPCREHSSLPTRGSSTAEVLASSADGLIFLYVWTCGKRYFIGWQGWTSFNSLKHRNKHTCKLRFSLMKMCLRFTPGTLVCPEFSHFVSDWTSSGPGTSGNLFYKHWGSPSLAAAGGGTALTSVFRSKAGKDTTSGKLLGLCD